MMTMMMTKTMMKMNPKAKRNPEKMAKAKRNTKN